MAWTQIIDPPFDIWQQGNETQNHFKSLNSKAKVDKVQHAPNITGLWQKVSCLHLHVYNFPMILSVSYLSIYIFLFIFQSYLFELFWILFAVLHRQTTANSSCVKTHLAIKADSDSDLHLNMRVAQLIKTQLLWVVFRSDSVRFRSCLKRRCIMIK